MMEILLLVLLAAGFIIIMWDSVTELAFLCRERLKRWSIGFREESKDQRQIKKSKGMLEGRLYDHICFLLQITLGMGTARSIRAFASASFILAGGTLFSLFGKVPLPLSAGAAICTGLMPYRLLRLRLQKLRVNSSREGEILITELLENYKIEYFNMQQAIEKTASTIEDAPNSKRLLLNLAKGLNTAEKDRIGNLLREFRLSINTSWGNILTTNMSFALTSGVEVTEALTDLADTIKQARRVNEFARRENNEAAMILKYLAPLTYLLTAAGGIKLFGITAEKFFYYQFETEAGLTWFTISIIIYAAGCLLNTCLSYAKLDL